jgi:hypothetical protein
VKLRSIRAGTAAMRVLTPRSSLRNGKRGEKLPRPVGAFYRHPEGKLALGAVHALIDLICHDEQPDSHEQQNQRNEPQRSEAPSPLRRQTEVTSPRRDAACRATARERALSRNADHGGRLPPNIVETPDSPIRQKAVTHAGFGDQVAGAAWYGFELAA